MLGAVGTKTTTPISTNTSSLCDNGKADWEVRGDSAEFFLNVRTTKGPSTITVSERLG